MHEAYHAMVVYQVDVVELLGSSERNKDDSGSFNQTYDDDSKTRAARMRDDAFYVGHLHNESHNTRVA